MQKEFYNKPSSLWEEEGYNYQPEDTDTTDESGEEVTVAEAAPAETNKSKSGDISWMGEAHFTEIQPRPRHNSMNVLPLSMGNAPSGNTCPAIQANTT